MSLDSGRHLRADAARNVAQILRAARQIFIEQGPDAPLEAIARRAEVGPRTLYRHFPHKQDLVRAALELSVAEDLAPAIRRALAGEAWPGFVHLVDSAVELAFREHSLLAAARGIDSLTAELSTPFYDALGLLLRRAQDAGTTRDDLAPEDLPRFLGMLFSTLWNTDPTTDGWRRYLTILLDGMTTPTASTLPRAQPLNRSTRRTNR
jgi:AcrR family transcriptional regulator